MEKKAKKVEKEYIFTGAAGKNELISILGKRTTLKAKEVNVEVTVWDLDRKGNPIIENGEVKVKTITECVQSIRIWIPKGTKFEVLEK